MGIIRIVCKCGRLMNTLAYVDQDTEVQHAQPCSVCKETGRPIAKAKSERLIRRLHILMIAGQDDNEEADKIRDELDTHDRYLNGEDRQAIDNVSKQLWSEYDEAKGAIPGSRPETSERAEWLNPITNTELNRWQQYALNKTWLSVRGDALLRLIREIRALRHYLLQSVKADEKLPEHRPEGGSTRAMPEMSDNRPYRSPPLYEPHRHHAADIGYRGDAVYDLRQSTDLGSDATRRED